jgi:hypothetical protein
MTDDAAVVRLGARSYRRLRRTSGKGAKLRDEARKLREATEAQIRNQRDFLRIDGPEDLLQQPVRLLPGQEWGLWVLEDSLYEHLAVIGVRNGIVVAQTEEGQLVAVDQGQLLCRGHFLGWVR